MANTSTQAQVKATIDHLDTAVEAYIHARWSPIPVKPNDKKPMLRGCTGNIPELTDDETRALWTEVEGQEVNLGLRLPDTIIVLDVDEYLKKHGADRLAELEAELGVLPKTLTNTRRGADSRSRHYFFRVPAGFKWVSTLGDGIEILQATHRFAVVSPSEKDEEVYHWYAPDGSLYEGIPRVDDPMIAVLPPAWIERLKKDSLKPVNRPDERFIGSSAAEDAMAWLEYVARGYDAPMGPVFTKMLTGDNLDELKADLSKNGHDTMLSKQRWAIRLAAKDGENGLKTALEKLETLFVEEVTAPDRSSRRREACAHDEWTEALIGEVNALRGDHKAGAVRLYVEHMPVAIDRSKLTSLGGAQEARAAVGELMTRVEELLWEYGGDDLPAQLLLECCGDFMAWKLDLHNNGGLSLFDTEKGCEIPPGATFKPYLRRHVKPVIKAYRAQLPDPDTLEDETEKAQLKALLKKCSDVLAICESENRAKPVLAAVAGFLEERGDILKESDADRAENLLGLSDGHVINLDDWRDGNGLPASFRKRNRDEIVTKSLRLSSTEIRAGVARLEAGETAPVAELFRLVFGPDAVRQTVFELMAYSLHGSNPHRLVWGIQGGTGTGKSTVMGFFTRALGDYAAPTTMAALSDRSGGNNSAKARALRAPFAYTEEFSQDTKGNRDALKEIASNMPVSVTDKFLGAEEHRGTVIGFTTNEPARVDFDAALEDRFVVVPTACTQEQVIALLSGFEQGWDTDLLNRVWLMSMLADAYARPWSEGFRKAELPAEIQECTALFVAESNPGNKFVEDTLVFTGDEEDYVQVSRLFDEITEHGDLELTRPELTRLMATYGVEKVKRRIPVGPGKAPKWIYPGVRLRKVPDLTVVPDIDSAG